MSNRPLPDRALLLVQAALAGALMLWGARPAAAAPGDLDRSFGAGGIVVGSEDGGAAALVIQPDGKLVAAGTVDLENDRHVFGVARYLPNGTLDRTFGGDGTVTTDLGPGLVSARAVGLQRGGKIVVAGSAAGSNGSSSFALVRYLPNGTLDPTFGTRGRVLTAFRSLSEASALVVLSNGKLVAAGSGDDGQTSFAVARYNADGSLDRSFDGDGKVTTRLGDTSSATALAVAANGKLVAAGSAFIDGKGSVFALARYNTDGSLDRTFDGDGKVTTAGGLAEALTVAIQRDGRVVVGGVGRVRGPDQPVVVRYTAAGSLDRTFGAGGTVLVPFPGLTASARGLALQRDGRIVVVGSKEPWARPGSLVLLRLTASGRLDTTFSGDGKVTLEFAPVDGPGGDRVGWGSAAAIQPDGKIVVAGGPTFALARILGR